MDHDPPHEVHQPRGPKNESPDIPPLISFGPNGVREMYSRHPLSSQDGYSNPPYGRGYSFPSSNLGSYINNMGGPIRGGIGQRPPNMSPMFSAEFNPSGRSLSSPLPVQPYYDFPSQQFMPLSLPPTFGGNVSIQGNTSFSPPLNFPQNSYRPKLKRIMKSGRESGGSSPDFLLLAAGAFRVRFVTPVLLMLENWSPLEVQQQRRLVLFDWSLTPDMVLEIRLQAITPDQYRSLMPVVLCIFWEHKNACYITSHDVIFLLEQLSGSEGFDGKEKNRIRRNLQTLESLTIGKTTEDSKGSLTGSGRNFIKNTLDTDEVNKAFDRMMRYSNPRPRRIEKDIKIYKWMLVEEALNRVLSKYQVWQG